MRNLCKISESCDFFSYVTQCGKKKICSHFKKISWNQVIVAFVSKCTGFTQFFAKMVRVNFSHFHIVCRQLLRDFLILHFPTYYLQICIHIKVKYVSNKTIYDPHRCFPQNAMFCCSYNIIFSVTNCNNFRFYKLAFRQI